MHIDINWKEVQKHYKEILQNYVLKNHWYYFACKSDTSIRFEGLVVWHSRGRIEVQVDESFRVIQIKDYNFTRI